jgi:hypothetical protein
MRILAMAGLLMLLGGCESSVLRPAPPDVAGQADLFGPTTMRLHPIFTQVKSWSGAGKPDGIEAILEFDDQFGDPTKAAGAVIFELYAFRDGYPNSRGERLVEPWGASLAGVEQQQAHWRREIGAYSFLLSYDEIRTDRTYVLTATFEPLTGPRLFAKPLIIQPTHTTTWPGNSSN